jgi:hypothetical protein
MIVNSFEVCFQSAFICYVSERLVMKLPGDDSDTTDTLAAYVGFPVGGIPCVL